MLPGKGHIFLGNVHEGREFGHLGLIWSGDRMREKRQNIKADLQSALHWPVSKQGNCLGDCLRPFRLLGGSSNIWDSPRFGPG